MGSTERTGSGSAGPSYSPTSDPDCQCFKLREDCSESGTGHYFDSETQESGMCHNYEKLPFVSGQYEFEEMIEDLEEQSASNLDRIQSLVESFDELRMENYHLQQKINAYENTVEEIKERFVELAQTLRIQQREIDMLKSKGDDGDDDNDDEDDEDADREPRRCDGLSKENVCYELSNEKMNYNEAKAFCKREGGMLATWSSDMNVHRDLRDYAAEERGLPSSEYMWIGASYDAKTDKSSWADGRDVDIKVTRFTKQTSCGAIFKIYIAGFKCGNKFLTWCQFDNNVEM